MFYTYLYTVLGFNFILMFLSITLIKTLYSNNLIDKSNRNSLILISVLVPIYGIITIGLKYRRVINHLVRVKDINSK
jgi:hypothetical protein